MKLKFIFAAVALLSLSVSQSWAQVEQQPQKKLTKERAQLLIPRPSMQPVKSMDGGASAIDSLDTANPAVKIILFDDNTWQYWKDPEYTAQSELFTEFWNTELADPYTISLDQLPDRVTFWLIDSNGQYCCPRQTKVYSPFGYRHGRRHNGVDLPLHTGDPVKAAFSGKVRVSKYYKGFGNLIILRHENGLETYYGHLSKRNVDVGDWVSAGDIIGLGGSTGRSTGPHLHFETRYRGFAFDPQWIIDFETGILRHRAFVLKKKYLNANSKYMPENDDEDWAIAVADSTDRAAAAAKAAAEKAAAAAAQYHTVRSGDTLGKIAKRYGTSIKKICQLNGIKETTTLQIGRKLRVK